MGHFTAIHWVFSAKVAHFGRAGLIWGLKESAGMTREQASELVDKVERFTR